MLIRRKIQRIVAAIYGHVALIDGNFISYAFTKEINAMSTYEARYVAVSEAAEDIL